MPELFYYKSMRNIIGIDIGTTNIEYILADEKKGPICDLLTPNPLSAFGLDVMTRISKANDGRLDEMTSLLRVTIKNDIIKLMDDCFARSGLQISIVDIAGINIAANTTMVHILMNYDCSYLGSYPFSPVHIEAIKTDSDSLGFTASVPIPVNITQGFSAFVGGDIYSGLKTLPDCDDYLFIDLGTNAEMVLCLGNTAYITSAAAGPAFETCSKGHATDAIDGLIYMLKNGIMDETGLLTDEFFDSGYDCLGMHFSQKKIRDMQMAKSAVKTGIDLLIDSAQKDLSIDESFVSTLKVFIAGTFGYNLDINNCIKLGMFPEWFKDKATAVGNTSLKGTLVTDTDPQKNIREIFLANLPEFNDCYIKNMNFS